MKFGSLNSPPLVLVPLQWCNLKQFVFSLNRNVQYVSSQSFSDKQVLSVRTRTFGTLSTIFQRNRMRQDVTSLHKLLTMVLILKHKLHCKFMIPRKIATVHTKIQVGLP